jgi:acetyltransferase EpsM
MPLEFVKLNEGVSTYKGVYVGTGAAFIQNVSVGSWSTIGAGAVVTVNIPGKVTPVGVPAKVIKSKD